MARHRCLLISGVRFGSKRNEADLRWSRIDPGPDLRMCDSAPQWLQNCSPSPASGAMNQPIVVGGGARVAP